MADEKNVHPQDDLMQQIRRVNELLFAGEPDNIKVDTYAGYSGYKPQSIIDAMNDVLGIGTWGFKELSNEMTPTKDGGGLAIAQVEVWLKGIDFRPTGWGQSRVTKGDTGDAKKGAQTDALKKALSYFSIGNRAYHGLLEKEESKETGARSPQGGKVPPKPAGTTPVRPVTPPTSNGNGTQAQTQRSAPSAVATKEKIAPQQHAQAVAGTIPVVEVTPTRLSPFSVEQMERLGKNTEVYDLMLELQKRYGPSEEVAFRTYVSQAVQGISHNPAEWTEQQRAVVLKMADAWDSSTDTLHSHQGWSAHARALDCRPEQKEIFDIFKDAFKATHGSIAPIGYLRDAYTELKGKAIGQLTMREADWYILLLRTAPFDEKEKVLRAHEDFKTYPQD